MTRHVPGSRAISPLLDTIRARLPGVQGIWLFGSQARDQAGPESDIDLAVLALAPIDPVVLFDLGLELGVLANHDVDLIDLRRVSTVMRKEVLCEGVLAHVGDADACDRFMADSLALYVALQDEQRLVSHSSGGREGRS